MIISSSRLDKRGDCNKFPDFGIIWFPKLEFLLEEHYFLRGIPDRGDDLFACMQVCVIVGSTLFWTYSVSLFLMGSAVSAFQSQDRSVCRTAASAYSMPKVKLGRKEFNVDSEEIDAQYCRVSATDCDAFAARMRTGEISRVATLNLVRFIVLIAVRLSRWILRMFFSAEFAFAFSSACVMTNMSFAGRQPSRQRWSEVHCCRSATQQQRADAAPCKMNFVDGL
jgi:hypothetical protein